MPRCRAGFSCADPTDGRPDNPNSCVNTVATPTRWVSHEAAKARRHEGTDVSVIRQLAFFSFLSAFVSSCEPSPRIHTAHSDGSTENTRKNRLESFDRRRLLVEPGDERVFRKHKEREIFPAGSSKTCYDRPDMKQSDALAWVAQWRAASTALGAVRAQELAELDEAKSAKIAATFFVAPGVGIRRLQNNLSSGLVEQQAIFLRAR